MRKLAFLVAVAPLILTGCNTSSQTATPSGNPVAMDQSVPQIARDACLKEVARTTNTQQGIIVDMLYSEANSQVTVGVGPERARWQCTVSNSGVVANVMSLTNEGAL